MSARQLALDLLKAMQADMLNYLLPNSRISEHDLVTACRALIEYCDKNPPMGDSLWSVQCIRSELSGAPAVQVEPVAYWFNETIPTPAKRLMTRETKESLIADNYAEESAFEPLYATPQEPAAPAWQEIETAPKDGTNIIGGVEGFDRSVGEMFWWEGAWRTWDGENHTRTVAYPTHWMPLPAAPKP